MDQFWLLQSDRRRSETYQISMLAFFSLKSETVIAIAQGGVLLDIQYSNLSDFGNILYFFKNPTSILLLFSN